MSERERAWNLNKSPCSTRAAEQGRCGESRPSLGNVCCSSCLGRRATASEKTADNDPTIRGNSRMMINIFTSAAGAFYWTWIEVSSWALVCCNPNLWYCISTEARPDIIQLSWVTWINNKPVTVTVQCSDRRDSPQRRRSAARVEQGNNPGIFSNFTLAHAPLLKEGPRILDHLCSPNFLARCVVQFLHDNLNLVC